MNILRRWWRGKTEVATTIVVCLALVAIAVLDGRLAGQVSIAIDKNWRGLYDILVTPSGQDFGGSRTQGLVDGNFVATAGSGGITLRQLAEIRRLSGVSVAAPVGMVGVLRDVALTPLLNIPDDPAAAESVLTSPVTAARISSTLTWESGSEERVLSKSTGVIVVTRRNSITSTSEGSASGYPAGFGPQTTSAGFQVPLGILPSFATSVIAVDPTAEQKLLGENGRFLGPLSVGPKSRDTLENGDSWAARVDPKKYLVQQTAIESAAALKQSKQVVPLVVNNSMQHRLSLAVSIEQTDQIIGLPTAPDDLRGISQTAKFTPWTTVKRDVSSLTVPFSSPNLSLAWPGSTLPEGDSGGSFYTQSTSLTPALIGRPSYSKPAGSSPDSTHPSYTVNPRGIRSSDGQETSRKQDEIWGVDPVAGLVQSYRELKTVSGGGFAQALPAPVGEFTTADLNLGDAKDASYVPSGIYDPGKTRMLAHPDGSAMASNQTVEPSLSQLDFITTAPGAITDLAGGRTLRGSDPIDAIRVRVSGIASYSTASRNRVLDIATSISAMGLRAAVVAGSSPQPVNVYVPDYKITGFSSSGDLGWVRQNWTTLGAVVTVSSAMTTLQYGLLYSAVGILILSIVAVLITSGRRRRAETALLRDLGWTRAQVRRRMIALQLPGVGFILATSIAVLMLKPSTALVGPLSGVVLTGAALLAALLGAKTKASSKSRSTAKGLRDPISSLKALSWRHVKSSPGRYFSQFVGLVAVGLSIALTSAVLLNGQQQSGQTRLAAVVMSSTSVSLVLLGSAAAAAALVLAFLGRSSDIKQQDEEARTLRAMGFSRNIIRSLRISQTLVLVTVSLIGGMAVCVAVALFSKTGVAPIAAGFVAIMIGAGFLVMLARAKRVE